MTPTTSLLDRANLDRDSVRHQVARGLEGADDGELFLEYGQTEALMFDNGRLKQATYDTSQGFGLRAVKDDAVGYAHSSDVSLPAFGRAADAVLAVRGGYAGSFAAPPPRTNVKLYGDENPLDAPGFDAKGWHHSDIPSTVVGALVADKTYPDPDYGTNLKSFPGMDYSSKTFFANQDMLPKGGFGNLIALPLQKQPREHGHSVFVDEEFIPYPDQWAFLSTVDRLSPGDAQRDRILRRGRRRRSHVRIARRCGAANRI